MAPVAPDMSLILYFSLTASRLFWGGHQPRHSLDTEITLLKARVGTLKRDKDFLMDRCEAA